MPEPFQVEPDPIVRESNRLLDSVAQSRSAHRSHHEALEDAAPGMLGASKAALEAAHAALTDRTAALHHQLNEHGAGMQEFTGHVIETEQNNRDRLARGQ